MSEAPTHQSLNWKQSFLYSLGAIASFHLAYAATGLEILIAGFLFCLLRLAWQPTKRRAFYFGLGIGFAIYAPHLKFFWEIFGWTAALLWLVLAFWLGIFLLLARAVLVRFGKTSLLIAAPFLWTGLEFFRSELYYLRFTWLNVGYVFSTSPTLEVIRDFGVYGIGFLIMAVIAIFLMEDRKPKFIFAVIVILAIAWNFPANKFVPAKTVAVAGVQMESPSLPEAVSALDKTAKRFPQAELLVLSEYFFHEPIPKAIKVWCRKNKKFLVAGGQDFLPGYKQFYDTAFVVDPNGEIIFKQAKSVPIQFFNDGLPAREQKLWDSPWGKIGFCICYDLSYTRVTDELIRQGAQAIIVPTLDAKDWGEHQHRLHGRIAPMRAAEYGVPIFRVDGCGISQLVHPDHRVEVTEPFPADGAMIGGELRLAEKGRVPQDRGLAHASLVVTAGIILRLASLNLFRRKKLSTPPSVETSIAKP